MTGPESKKSDASWVGPLIGFALAFVALGYCFGMGPLAGLQPEPDPPTNPLSVPGLGPTVPTLTRDELDRLLQPYPTDEPEQQVCYPDGFNGYSCE